MRKILLCVGAVILVLVSASCNISSDYSGITGYEQVSKAQKLYAELESGHFYMQNNDTGEKTEEFTFRYREDGQLSYMYAANDGSGTYLEFHNGSEINTKTDKDADWSFISQGNENYYSYSKDNKHPYTTEGVISMNAFAVTEGKAEELSEGGEKISFSYNPSLLASAFSEIGKLESFTSAVWINEEGYCYRLDQVGKFDGGKVMDYSMFIDSMNEVEKVERTDEQ